MQAHLNDAGADLCLSLIPVAGRRPHRLTAGRVKISSGVLNVKAPYLFRNRDHTEKDSYVTLIRKAATGGRWNTPQANTDTATRATSSGFRPYAMRATGHLNVRTGVGTTNLVIGWLQPGRLHRGAFHDEQLAQDSPQRFPTRVRQRKIPDRHRYAPYPQCSSFKQTDSRWASAHRHLRHHRHHRLPTTALAMTESFRTKTTIYPNQMATGWLYPGAFTAITRLFRQRLPQGRL